jgi:hypothetical protein
MESREQRSVIGMERFETGGWRKVEGCVKSLCQILEEQRETK